MSQYSKGLRQCKIMDLRILSVQKPPAPVSIQAGISCLVYTIVA